MSQFCLYVGSDSSLGVMEGHKQHRDFLNEYIASDEQKMNWGRNGPEILENATRWLEDTQWWTRNKNLKNRKVMYLSLFGNELIDKHPTKKTEKGNALYIIKRGKALQREEDMIIQKTRQLARKMQSEGFQGSVVYGGPVSPVIWERWSGEWKQTTSRIADKMQKAFGSIMRVENASSLFPTKWISEDEMHVSYAWKQQYGHLVVKQVERACSFILSSQETRWNYYRDYNTNKIWWWKATAQYDLNTQKFYKNYIWHTS